MADPPRGAGELPPTDQELIARLRAGHEQTFGAVVRAWSPGMLRVARSYVSTADSAAEVVQDTWLAAIEGIGQFQARSSVQTWVYRILINTAKRRGTREGRTIALSSLPTMPGDTPTVDPRRFQGPAEDYPGHWREFPAPWPTSVDPTPENEALATEIRTHLQTALERLPDRQRVVITLRDVVGLSSDEVCGVLDISPSNQRVLLHRARASVRGELEVYFTETS